MTEKPFYTSLKNRGILRISGKDRIAFLQGLITNDLALLAQTACIYSCLLTPQGKFQYDFFITQENDILILDCEGKERLEGLLKLLSLYRLRADVRIEAIDDTPVYAVFGAVHGIPDPRHPEMGRRSFSKPENLEFQDFNTWDERRIRLCIPDGSRDMVVGQSTLLECRIDRLNGVSFDKGCYMGQELTARTHYRGLVKKHLYALESQALPVSGAEIIIDGWNLGEMRSTCGNVGLALLKDEEIDQIHQSGLKIISC